MTSVLVVNAGSSSLKLRVLDTLVFTGGIGEHQSQTRTEAASGLGFLGRNGSCGCTWLMRIRASMLIRQAGQGSYCGPSGVQLCRRVDAVG